MCREHRGARYRGFSEMTEEIALVQPLNHRLCN